MDTNVNDAALRDDVLALVPLRESVLFPGAVMPLAVASAPAIAALQAAAQDGHTVLVVLQRDPSVEQPALTDLHPVGTEARLLRYVTTPDGTHQVILQGRGRVRLLDWQPQPGFPAVRVERVAEPEERSPEIDARFHQLKERALETLRLLEQAPPALAATVQAIDNPGQLADLVASLIDIPAVEKQEMLETVPLQARLDRVLWRLAYRLQVLRLSADIGERTRETMEGRQREFLLREQLKRDPEGAGRGRRRLAGARRISSARSTRPGCRRRSRSRRGASCAGSSGCRRAGRNPAWCAPISNG